MLVSIKHRLGYLLSALTVLLALTLFIVGILETGGSEEDYIRRSCRSDQKRGHAGCLRAECFGRY